MGPGTIGITFAMMLLAWNVSGGHFNPAISLGVWASQGKFGEDAVTLIIMIVSQFAGAMLGILLGFLSLIDKVYQQS